LIQKIAEDYLEKINHKYFLLVFYDARSKLLISLSFIWTFIIFVTFYYIYQYFTVCIFLYCV